MHMVEFTSFLVVYLLLLLKSVIIGTEVPVLLSVVFMILVNFKRFEWSIYHSKFGFEINDIAGNVCDVLDFKK